MNRADLEIQGPAAAIAADPLQCLAELSRLPRAERVPPVPSAFEVAEVAAAHCEPPDLRQLLGDVQGTRPSPASG